MWRRTASAQGNHSPKKNNKNKITSFATMGTFLGHWKWWTQVNFVPKKRFVWRFRKLKLRNKMMNSLKSGWKRWKRWQWTQKEEMEKTRKGWGSWTSIIQVPKIGQKKLSQECILKINGKVHVTMFRALVVGISLKSLKEWRDVDDNGEGGGHKLEIKTKKERILRKRERLTVQQKSAVEKMLLHLEPHCQN